MIRRHPSLSLQSLIVTAGLTLTPVIGFQFPITAQAQSLNSLTEEDTPILLSADEIIHDQNLNLVTARGAVELSQGGRTLIADIVNYSPGTDVVSANGNVSLMEPGGEVMFAEYMELNGTLKDGFIRDIRIILKDNSRLAASGGRRSSGNFTELANAVYSPCEACEEDPSRSLLWQIRAKRVLHDQTRKEIEYRDATLDFLGIPVMYAPFFSHPDPTVKRRDGFLAPTFGSGSDTGAYVRVPYLWALSPSKDFTLAPTVTAEAGMGLAADYRERFETGVLTIEGSAIQTGDGTQESHIDIEGRFDIDDNWRWGVDLERASSDDYLSRYSFDSKPLLITNAFQEGFFRRSYARADLYAFQGLEDEDDPGTSPLVLPELQYNYLSDPGRHGGMWLLDGNLRGFSRSEGSNSQRVSLKSGWTLPHTGKRGDVSRLTATVQADAYAVQNTPRSGKSDYDGFTGRLHPQLSYDWRMPFYKANSDGSTQVVEPIFTAAVAPAGGNPEEIPNEDSQTLELDDVNIFSPDRFGGVDRVEDGARFSYGGQWSIHGRDGGSSHVLIGQSVRTLDNDTFSNSSGLSGRLSDFVGRVRIEPRGPLDFIYRFRADKDDMEFVRNQLTANGNWDLLSATVNYFHARHSTGSGTFPEREELSGNMSLKVSPEWRVKTSARRDLTDSGGMVQFAMGGRYEDECFVFDLNFTRDYTDDLGVGPSDSMAFQLSFKTLGDVQSNVDRP